MNLDRIDRKILSLLDQNSRLPFAELAERLKLPQETVRYRVKCLTDHGVIKNFLTVFDGGKLGFYYYKVFLRLHNISENKITQIVEYLCSQDSVNWVVRVEGEFHIGFTIAVTHAMELSCFMDGLKEHFAQSLLRCAFSVNIQMEFFSRPYLVDGRSGPFSEGVYTAKGNPYPADNKDWAIIRELAKGSRLSAADIGRNTGMSADAALRRIDKLERERVILRYHLVLDNKLLGQINYYVLVNLNYVAPKTEEKFIEYCRKKKNVVYLIKSLGEWDYELSIEAPTLAEYRKVMMELTSDYSSVVKDYRSLIVDEIFKYVYP